MAKYTTKQLRDIAYSKTPDEWGDKKAALLWAADVIDAARALLEDNLLLMRGKDNEKTTNEANAETQKR